MAKSIKGNCGRRAHILSVQPHEAELGPLLGKWGQPACPHDALMERDSGTAAQGQITGIGKVTESAGLGVEHDFHRLPRGSCRHELRSGVKRRSKDARAQAGIPALPLIVELRDIVIRTVLGGAEAFWSENRINHAAAVHVSAPRSVLK